jgi:hypothetical protein
MDVLCVDFGAKYGVRWRKSTGPRTQLHYVYPPSEGLIQSFKKSGYEFCNVMQFISIKI